MPSDTLKIQVEDGEKPFQLENLDQRFDAKSLTDFLDAYVERLAAKGISVSILVANRTKRIVDGEQLINKCLKQLSETQAAIVVYLPVPTSLDPNEELRKFADEFAPNE
jgi:hypothetical protein